MRHLLLGAVAALAAERPVLGWGWVSYWAPWAAPFDTLAERKGVLYLQAHNAALDVWFQLGAVGLVLFTALVVSTLWRSWFRAVDRPRRSATAARQEEEGLQEAEAQGEEEVHQEAQAAAAPPAPAALASCASRGTARPRAASSLP